MVFTPGHTPGSISLYSARDKVLFAGDLINTRYAAPRIPYRVINYDTHRVKESVKLIAKLDFEILCTGHGQPITQNADISVRRLAESI